MKYNISINQTKCMEYGLNLSQGAVMEILLHLSTRADAKEINGVVYYKLTAGKIADELPMISNKKNTFLNILRVLIDKDLLYRYSKDNSSYYRITEKGKLFYKGVEKNPDGMEKNPQGYGKKSTLGVEKNPYNNTTIYNTTKDNTTKDNINNIYNDEKAISLKDTYTQIYNHWNEQGVIVHKSITKQMQKWIDKRIEEYSIEDILIGIKNYADVVKSDDTYFTHKWTLQEFLQREGGLQVFLYKGINDYLKKVVYVNDNNKNDSDILEFNDIKTQETFDLLYATYPKNGDLIKSKQGYLTNPNSANELQKHAKLMNLMVKYSAVDAQYIPNIQRFTSESINLNENYYIGLYKKMGECMGKKSPFKPDQMRDDLLYVFEQYPGLKGVYRESKEYWTERTEKEKENNPFK